MQPFLSAPLHQISPAKLLPLDSSTWPQTMHTYQSCATRPVVYIQPEDISWTKHQTKHYMWNQWCGTCTQSVSCWTVCRKSACWNQAAIGFLWWQWNHMLADLSHRLRPCNQGLDAAKLPGWQHRAVPSTAWPAQPSIVAPRFLHHETYHSI